jgi:hypothetical protein
MDMFGEIATKYMGVSFKKYYSNVVFYVFSPVLAFVQSKVQDPPVRDLDLCWFST